MDRARAAGRGLPAGAQIDRRLGVQAALCELQGYRCYWHGVRAYSGVGLHIRRDAFADEPQFFAPSQFRGRNWAIVTAQVGDFLFVSVYVPNRRQRFFPPRWRTCAVEAFIGEAHAGGMRGVCAATSGSRAAKRDVHPKERNPTMVGQRPDEREIFERVVARGLVDVGRALGGATIIFSPGGRPGASCAPAHGWRIDTSWRALPWRLKPPRCASYREVGRTIMRRLSQSFDLES